MHPFQEKAEDYEIQLRGVTLDVSVKFEIALMDIVYFSNSEQYNDPTKSDYLKIKNLTFGGKINRVKKLLSIYHSDLLIKYESLFKILDDFLQLRNRLAHCAMYWTDDKLENLEIWEVMEGYNKLQFYTPIPYTRLGISQSLVAFLKQIAPTLLSLQNEVQLRLKQSNPKLYSGLTSALDNEDQAK